MKARFLFFMSVVALAGHAGAHEEPFGLARNGLQATLGASQETYSVGETIELALNLKNVTASPHDIGIDTWPGNWSLTVSRVEGAKWTVIPPAAVAADVLRPAPIPFTLAHGKEWTIHVSGLSLSPNMQPSPLWKYSTLAPGTYYIGAKYDASAAPDAKTWSGHLTSRLVKIEITQAGKN